MKTLGFRFSIFLFFALFLSFSSLLRAQTEIEGYVRRTPYDSSYIETYVDQLVIKGLGVKKSNKLNLMNKEGKREASFKPNENFNVGFGFNYRFLGLNLAFDLPFINNDDDKYGHTNVLDLELNIVAPSFGGHIYYQHYKGFYIDNPKSSVPEWTENMVYPKRPDLRTLNAGAEFHYVFNYKKFSQRATFTQNERQKRSAGSWLLGSYVTFFDAVGDSSLVPRPLRPLMEIAPNTENVRMLNVGVSGGYIHTFVFKKCWYFTISAETGFALQNLTNKEQEVFTKNEWGLGHKFKSRMGFGYNGKKYFAGFSSIMDNMRISREKSAWLESSLTQFRLFFGTRLDFDYRKTANQLFKKKK